VRRDFCHFPLTSISFQKVCRASRGRCLKKLSAEKTYALKLCKQEQAVEESELTIPRGAFFHTLINTSVENLIVQKYFFASSA
jgi:hypothetical protein